MIWILMATIWTAIAATLGYVIGSGLQRAEAEESWRLADTFCAERNDARAQRDRLNMECAAMRLQLEEIVPRYERMERENAELQAALARYEQEYAPVNHTPPTTGGVVPELG